MLGKLLKHEFKETTKLLLPLNLIMVAITILGAIFLKTKMYQNESLIPMLIACLIFYVLALLALALVTYIYLAVRYYKTMYADRGYLSHTLPVTPLALVNSKLLVGAFWTFVNLMLTMISVFCLIFSAADIDFGSTSWSTVSEQINLVTGYSLSTIVWFLLLYLVVCSFSGLITSYFCIGTGQLFSKHKVAAAVVTYVIYYFVNQIISSILMMIVSIKAVGTNEVLFTNSQGSLTLSTIYTPLMVTSLIFVLVLSVIFYCVNAFYVQKNVNLD